VPEVQIDSGDELIDYSDIQRIIVFNRTSHLSICSNSGNLHYRIRVSEHQDTRIAGNAVSP